MVINGNVIYNIGDCVVIRVDQIAKQRIVYNKQTKKHTLQPEIFEGYGVFGRKNIVLEYLGNGNFRESISGIIITIDPYDERVAPKTKLRGYEEEYEQSNNAPIDKALEHPLTIIGSWNLIDLAKLREISKANNPETISQITPEETSILRNSIYPPSYKKLLSEFISALEEEAHETINNDFASLISRAQESAEDENANLEDIVNLANEFLEQIGQNNKIK